MSVLLPALLEQALALNTQDTGILYALGVVYYKLGNLKLSKSYFASVLEINPEDQHAKGLMDIVTKLQRKSATNVNSVPLQAGVLQQQAVQSEVVTTAADEENKGR